MDRRLLLRAARQRRAHGRTRVHEQRGAEALRQVGQPMTFELQVRAHPGQIRGARQLHRVGADAAAAGAGEVAMGADAAALGKVRGPF